MTVSRFLLPVFLVCLIAPMSAQADSDRHDPDRGRGRWERHDDGHHSRHDHHDHRPPVVTYRSSYYLPRTTYYYEQPVYQPAFYYVPRGYVGQRLIRYREVPGHYLVQLPQTPYGYYYSMVDNDVVMVSQNDNIIAQALALLWR